jgi:hypothetical protein
MASYIDGDREFPIQTRSQGLAYLSSVSDFGANIRHIGAPYPNSELRSVVSELRI